MIRPRNNDPVIEKVTNWVINTCFLFHIMCICFTCIYIFKIHKSIFSHYYHIAKVIIIYTFTFEIIKVHIFCAYVFSAGVRSTLKEMCTYNGLMMMIILNNSKIHKRGEILLLFAAKLKICTLWYNVERISNKPWASNH